MTLEFAADIETGRESDKVVYCPARFEGVAKAVSGDKQKGSTEIREVNCPPFFEKVSGCF